MSIADDATSASADSQREQIHSRRRRFVGWVLGVPVAAVLTLALLGGLINLAGGGQ